ncbi:hypothetical protein LENED_002291 [Lentinula edodes]|uniref:Uncharacterized protein n=1 Tax=Lentinula edodes TaxID=5353 RepID=A0A1Q3E0V0_LENED|nr:hypothetical protein LENED_002291 [Lentinula edodes]
MIFPRTSYTPSLLSPLSDAAMKEPRRMPSKLFSGRGGKECSSQESNLAICIFRTRATCGKAEVETRRKPTT